MLLSNFALLLLAIGCANASPLRVTVVNSYQEVSVGPATPPGELLAFRLGHAAVNAGSLPALEASRVLPPGQSRKKGCNKAVDVANALRKTFGMPLIEVTKIEGHVHAVPIPVDNIRTHGALKQDQSFPERVHRALMTLGPWESRAVAFVLGCGIGVLLRMFWVMAVVLFRVLGGTPEPEDDVEYTLVFDHVPLDAEDIIVPPPQYTDEKIDEKVDV